jgi:predicted nucleic acid-binding protein
MRPDAAKLIALGPVRLVVAAITHAELAEGEFAADPAVRLRTLLDLALARQAYGPGLPFDDSAAQVYPAVCRAVVQSGRALGRARRIDMMIAAIALANGCGLATRNTDDFLPLATMLALVDL